jgi:hypothetical protein
VHAGLVDLTGGYGESLKLSALDRSVLWQKLLAYVASGDLLGAGSAQGRDTDFTPEGIVRGHAYAVLQVVEVDAVQLLQLRNPWGTSTWNGRFCDADAGRSSQSAWTQRLKQKTKFKALQAVSGTHWMDLTDFLRNFETLFVCRLFRSPRDSPPGPWHTQSVVGTWSRAAGTATGYKDVTRAPQFKLTLARPANVFATLALDGGPGDDVNIAVFLCRAERGSQSGGKLTRLTSQGMVAGSAPFTNLPTVSVNAPGLPVAAEGYYLLPVTFEAGHERAWSITVFADYVFELVSV